MYYECHITIEPKFIQMAEELAKTLEYKVSEIAGDEVLGENKFGYITFHAHQLTEIINKMERITKEAPFPFIRRKIEHIIYDSSTKHSQKKEEALRRDTEMASDISGESGP